MIYMVDIDGTICQSVNSDYENSQPIQKHIDHVNQLHDQGHTIIYWTARGANSGIDWTEFTQKQLNSWGVKHHEIRLGKPHYDVWVDDKANWIFD